MKTIAIIPARGGSKRIPRKNIKNFLGKPILAYSIKVALDSNLFDEVMVSTDDDEIAAIARSCGAVVPFMRSKSNSDDFASTVGVILEVLKEYEGVGRKFQFGCCIYPTAPFIKPERLTEGFRIMVGGNYDTVFPISKFSYPIWRALTIVDGKVSMIWPENMSKRSQDLQSAYHDAGQWYWFNSSNIVENKKLWTENTYGLEIDELEVQDIDNESDWRIAELKFSMQTKK